MKACVYLGIGHGDLWLAVKGYPLPEGAEALERKETDFWLRRLLPADPSPATLHALADIAEAVGHVLPAAGPAAAEDVHDVVRDAIAAKQIVVFRKGGNEGGGKGPVPEPPKPPQPQPAKQVVNPLIDPAELTLVVKKEATNPKGVKEAYTHPARHPITLKTDAAFDGTGTFECDKPAAVTFWSQKTGGTQIKINGTDNVFKHNAPPAWAPKNASLSSGITVFAEAVTASAKKGDIKLTLKLSGGSKTNGADDTTTVTNVEVTLEICKGRPTGGGDPPPLSQDDKAFVGRNLLVQDTAGHFERAMLIIKQVKPSDYDRPIVLSAKGHVTAFPNEKPTKGEKESLPYTIADPSKMAGPDKTLWAEGKSPSGDLVDSSFVLAVKDVEDDGDHVLATAVQIQLDICHSRKTTAGEPDAMSADDKVKVGRFVHEQDDKGHHGRALLVVRKIKPAKFKGTLAIKGVNAAKIELMPNELVKGGEKAQAIPFEIDYDPKDAAKKNEDKKFWVQGKKGGASAALRDVAVFMHLKDDNSTNADTILMTVVKFTDLEIDIPSTAANQVRTAQNGGGSNSPVARHKLKLTGGSANPNDYDHDYDTNIPIVLIEGSIRAVDKIKLSVKITPALAAPHVLWSIPRDLSKTAPKGDDDKIVKLAGNSDNPGLAQDAVKKLEATLTANAVGSFHIQPYIDNNGNATNEFDDKGTRIDREPYICMNLVLVRVEGVNNLTVTDDTAGARDIVMANVNYFGAGAIRVPRSVATGGGGKHAVLMKVIARVTGGGDNGKRGLDRVFAGWVNNELNAAGSPGPGGFGEDLTCTFRKRGVPLNPSAQTRCLWRTDGVEVGGPMLDSGYMPKEGIGGNTCTGTEGANETMAGSVKKKPDPGGLGELWEVKNGDSPGDGPIQIEHPADSAIAPAVNRRTLRNYKFNLDWRCALVFWTNRDKNETEHDAPACRLYSSVSTNTWNVRLESNFDDNFVETRVTRKTVKAVLDGNRRATPVDGSGIETRQPDGVGSLLVNIPFP